MTESPFESDHQWNMYASDGRGRISGTFKKAFSNSAGERCILTDVSIARRWPDRSQEIDFYEPPVDFEVRLHQVAFGVAQAKALLLKVSEWRHAKERFSVELCAEGDQSFLFSLYRTRSNDFGKDWVRIDYRGIGFDQGAWIMQVDQSCITIFIDELRNSFATATAQAK